MSGAQDNLKDRKVDPDRKLCADELKAMRKQRGWSQEETAARIKFSSATIANIESMRRAPTRDQAIVLDEAFEALRLVPRVRSHSPVLVALGAADLADGVQVGGLAGPDQGPRRTRRCAPAG